MIGNIVFGIGLGIFSVALVFWIVYLIKGRKAQSFSETLTMNNKMSLAGLFIAIGALIVNIGNLLVNHLS